MLEKIRARRTVRIAAGMPPDSPEPEQKEEEGEQQPEPEQQPVPMEVANPKEEEAAEPKEEPAPVAGFAMEDIGSPKRRRKWSNRPS